MQIILLHQVIDHCSRGNTVDQPGLHRLMTENDVFRHGQRRHQREMLVHHADALGGGIFRRPGRNMLTIDDDFSRRGILDAEQDFHERRFAGAVFTANGMDRSGADRKRHVAERDGAVRIDLAHIVEGDDCIAAFMFFSWI